MVLDSSCWANDAGAGAHAMLTNSNDNSVHRRPKIDFFDANSLDMNAVSENRAVFHISSNGYYGYAHHTAKLDSVDPTVMVDNTICMSEKHQQTQQVFTTENRKRGRCQLSSDNPMEVKRSRCAIDTIEDVQMLDDEPFDQMHMPVSMQSQQPQQQPHHHHHEQINYFNSALHEGQEGHIGNNNNSLVHNTSIQLAESTACGWPASAFVTAPAQRRTIDVDPIAKCHISWRMMSHMS